MHKPASRSGLPFVAAIAVLHLVLWLPLPGVAQTLALLALIGLTPGLLFVDLLVGQSEAPPDRWERWLYGAGAGYAIMALGMLLLSYLPGGMTAWHVLVGFDALLLALGALWWRRARRLPHVMGEEAASISRAGHWPWPAGIAVVTLLVIGGVLRFHNLGYAELLTDEARVVLRAAAVVQGYEDTLFLHRKGPVEIVLPAAPFAVLGVLNEASARLPFAVASLAALLAVFYLGWRLWGALAGASAALLLAVNGYLIGFARFVQYQSVVLLMSVLAVLILYRLLHRPAAVSRYLILAALLVATGLLSHYDGLVTLLPVALAIFFLFQRRRVEWATLTRAVGLAGVTGGLALALFYVPFVLHPNFSATAAYLLDNRLRAGDFPYNNLNELALRGMVYDPPLLVIFSSVMITAALAWAMGRALGRIWGILIGLLLGFVLYITLGQPAMLEATWVERLLLPFAVAIGLAWLAPRLGVAERMLWLWWGAPLLLAFFLVAQPGTHVYVVLTPSALLIGYLLQRQWLFLRKRLGAPAAWLIEFAPLAVVVAAVCVRAYFFFAYTDVEVLHAKQDRAQALEPTEAASPWQRFTIDRLYGFPLANGWKAVGMLYADGVLAGDYETNQRDDLLPDWYTRGQHRCAATATWYFAVNNLEAWSLGSQNVEELVLSQGYRPWGVVTVNDQPRMQIYTRLGAGEGDAGPLRRFPLEAYEARFDQTSTPYLPLSHPTVREPIANRLDVNFDGQIRLEGYKLEANQPLRPGDTLRLTLYWQALRPMAESYKVFNQAFYGDGVMVAQRDATPVCDRHPTNLWYPGERIADIHDITIREDAPDGLYPLFTGLYREADFARLPVLDDAGNPIAEQVEITQLQIGAP